MKNEASFSGSQKCEHVCSTVSVLRQGDSRDFAFPILKLKNFRLEVSAMDKYLAYLLLIYLCLHELNALIRELKKFLQLLKKSK